jgi:hypothetical protein
MSLRSSTDNNELRNETKQEKKREKRKFNLNERITLKKSVGSCGIQENESFVDEFATNTFGGDCHSGNLFKFRFGRKLIQQPSLA